MNFLDSLQAWIEETALYKEFLLRMPAPLNNIYFDTVLLALFLIYCSYRVVDSIQMSRRHRAVKERQLELKEKAAENEIHMINHEREARNQREEMNQFMRFMEMSLLAGSTKQMQIAGQQPTFEQFKEQERQQQITKNQQQTHDLFDTVNSAGNLTDDIPHIVEIREADNTVKLENERMAAELQALQEEKLRMEQAFAQKEQSREEAMARVKAQMEQREKEKQAEIDNLTNALSLEKEHNKKQIDDMVKNLSIYKERKQKEIANLEAKMATSSSADHNEKQAEIDRLTAEMNHMKQVQEQAIAEKENELARIATEKEHQIAQLTEEISNIKTKNNNDIQQLTAALQNAHDTQIKIEAEKAAEIEHLTSEISQLQKTKEAEIEAINREKEKAVSSLQSSLVEVENTVAQLNRENQERDEELAKLQEQLAENEWSSNKERKKLMKQVEVLRNERDTALSDKQAAEQEILELNNNLNRVNAISKQVIEVKQAEINNLAKAQEMNKKPVANADSKISKPLITPTNVVKTTFGNFDTSDEADSDFQRLMAQVEHYNAKAQEMENARKSKAESADANKAAMEQQLVVEAKIENSREIHTEDAAKLEAIDEQKERAREQVRREEEKRREEEERAKNGKTKKGLSGLFGKK